MKAGHLMGTEQQLLHQGRHWTEHPLTKFTTSSQECGAGWSWADLIDKQIIKLFPYQLVNKYSY